MARQVKSDEAVDGVASDFKAPEISPITDDFQREDLNRLRDAVNALIARG